MTLDQFLRKYNKCPFCRSYIIQGAACDHCRWKWSNDGKYAKDTDMDKFDPSDEWINRMNMEVDDDII